jgi:predicted CXXCH cytochrome family protein
VRLALLFLFALAAEAATCAQCHKAQAEHFAQSGMARALVAAKDSPLLRNKLTARLGPFSYEIAGAVLTVTDGKTSLTTPLAWAFGAGAVGQTWLFEREGRWYESRVSYYATLARLDLTIGQSEPETLTEALGRLTSTSEAARCFSCHGSQRESITCERCHGADPHSGALKNLSAEATSDFCGQCHRTWAQIAANGPRGIENIRFQPYRLANSKCYDTSDRRIRCTACHDPHRAIETSTTAYDGKCAACHSSCRAGQSRDCVSCHMPRLELPAAHQKFTDHRIRVVKANERYPD